MKYDIIVADPPWGSFSDKLTMSKTKRGAKANYTTMTGQAIKDIPIANIANNNCLLALWVPGCLLQLGMDTLSAWGFRQTQTWTWAKTTQDPYKQLKKQINSLFKNKDSVELDQIMKEIDSFDLNLSLKMNMGRTFRQAHETVLIGVKGSVSKELKNLSQKSVLLAPATKHSRKPEGLQDRLDIMFPNLNKLELFARRDRPSWTCIGLECPTTLNEDINASITRLAAI